MSNNLKYLNALNILAVGNPKILERLEQKFDGDWERAWNSDLNKFFENWKEAKKRINPEKGWQKVLTEDIKILTKDNPDYPKRLKEIADPPFLLYIRGDLKENENCFAVVGSRKFTEYGQRAVTKIVGEIANAGFTIVSGLAAGIDTLTHQATLAAGVKTIAVFGTGVDDASIFPPQNLNLARKILSNRGALISEYAPSTPGMKHQFPARNRIISGLSRGVLIVEADERSGSLITAKCALDQNRDVFAVPGSIFTSSSRGTNAIIKKGAKPVTCAEDILEEYEIEMDNKNTKANKRKAGNETEAKILACLTDEPITANDIIRLTGIAPADINVALTMMELNSKIKNLGNGKFTT